MEPTKRKFEEVDPDYVFIEQNKIQRISEAASEPNSRLPEIVKREFETEIERKEKQLETIDERLKTALKTLHLLRTAVVTSYYTRPELLTTQPNQNIETAQINDSKINAILSTQSRPHPAIRKIIGTSAATLSDIFRPSRTRAKNNSNKTQINLRTELKHESVTEVASSNDTSRVDLEVQNGDEKDGGRNERFKKKYRIIIGNISKWILNSCDNNKFSHKWMCYVRGDVNNPDLSHIIKKVRFFLHPSYIPNDLIEITDPPFHLSRRGWGEFPLRIQIHFKNNINKPIDVIHNLKLDKTKTGLETLGAETLVDIWLYRKSFNEIHKQIIPKPDHDNELINLSNDENDEEQPVIESPYKIIPNPNNFSIPDVPKSIPKLVPKIDLLNSDGNLLVIVRSIEEMHCYCKRLDRDVLAHLEMKKSDKFAAFIQKLSNPQLACNVTNVILYLLRHLPLITTNATDENYLQMFPYVSASIEMFMEWPKCKQFYSEWYRAKFIHRLIAQYQIPNHENWTTKSILKFSRLSGFGENPFSNEPTSSTSTKLPHSSSTNLQSYTELESQLQQILQNKSSKKSYEDENIEVNITDLEPNDKKPHKTDVTSIPRHVINFDSDINVPKSRFIKDMVQEIGIELGLDEIITDTWAPTPEICLAVVAKCFVEDLVRRSLLASNKVKKNVIEMNDVKSALLSREEFDLILNTDLGKPKS